MRFIRLALWAFILGLPLLAQIRSGTITGAVTDPAGAPVPNANVSVVETATNQSYNVVTSSSGEFSVPYLPPGSYTVRVETAGFSPAEKSGFALGTSQTARVDFTLRVSTVQESVVVSAATVQLQTESATVAGTFNEKTIQNVPNVNHNPLYYALLQAGVVPRQANLDTTGPNSFGIGITGRRNFSAFSINGGNAFSNDITVDGVSVQGSAWNEASVLPNPDGIQEVRTSVNNFSAEYGRAQGVVSLTTKSGTNQFHGSGFYRHRNDLLNANRFSNNTRGIERPDFKVHTFGGTIGGPIKKDKAFFFTSYEGLVFDDQVQFLRTVPTELERVGNFSQTYVGVNGAPTLLRLYDPYNVVALGNNQFQRVPIPSSVIPNPDPRILRYVQNFPLPNRTPDNPPFTTNNYFQQSDRSFRRNNLNARVDYRVSQNNSLYLTGGFTRGKINYPKTWGPDNPYNSSGEGFAPLNEDRNPYASIGDTFVLSPTLVVDVRYGINRIVTNSLTPPVEGYDYREFGVPQDIINAIVVPGVPINNFGSAYWSPLENNAYQHKRERQTNHNLVGSMTKTAGKWTFKAGGEMRVLLSNYTDPQESVSFRLNQGLTAGPVVNQNGGLVGAVNADQNGHPWASLLLGAGNLEIGQGFAVQPAFAQKYYAIYTQNDWRPTSRLTVNLGLRWDLQPGPTERYDRISSFDGRATNPFGARGAMAFAGTNGYSRNMWNTRYKDFGPRVGFAWRVTDTFVVRGGYGLTYLPSNTGFYDGPYNYGMQSFAPFTDAQLFGSNPQGVVVGDYAQVTRLVAPRGSDPTNPGIYGIGAPRFPRDSYVNGRSQQWNLFLQKKTIGNFLMSAGYSASKSDHLSYSAIPVNSDQYLPDSLLNQYRQDYIARNGTGHFGNDPVQNPLQPPGGPRIPFLGNAGNLTVAQRTTLYPYFLFGGLSINSTIGFANYHAFMAQVNKQFSNGLQFDAHYTWSKSLDFSAQPTQFNGYDDNFSQNPTPDLRNLRNSYRLSANDIPHRFVISYVYELPFGKGKRFSGNTLSNALLGGWQLGGVGNFQSGPPLSITGGNSGSINGRPDLVPGVPLELPRELQKWYDSPNQADRTVTLPSGRSIVVGRYTRLRYNPDAFRGRVVTTANGSVQRDVFWWGNAAQTYNSIRTNGLANWNMSVARQFRIRESMSLEASLHASNVFNHTQFSSSGFTRDLGGIEIRDNPAAGQLPGYSQNQNFGGYGLSTYDPRQIELIVKFRF